MSDYISMTEVILSIKTYNNCLKEKESSRRKLDAQEDLPYMVFPTFVNFNFPELWLNNYILGLKKFDHVSAVRKSLGWRSVRQKPR